jgi:DNA-binding LacI/PurR family transcriptional regulator
MKSLRQKRVTLSDVAKRAGVSTMTASYAFNRPARVSEGSRRRVFAASAELGYQGANPWARSLRTGKSNTLGVVFGEHLTYAFSDPQAAEFLSGVASVCVEKGLGLTFIPTRGVEGDAERVAAAPVDGYVFWTTVADDPSLAAAVASGRPSAIQGGPTFPGIVRVGPNDRQAAFELCRLALVGSVHPVIVSFSLDHTRVAQSGFGLPIAKAKLPVTRERLLGFQDRLVEVGFSWEQVRVIALGRNQRSEAKSAFGELLADQTLPVDSALCMSDELAIGVLDAASEQGVLVPDMLSVVGWDDGPSAQIRGLTSLRQSLYDQGRICGEIAAGMRSADGSEEASNTEWSVVERTSTRTHPRF